MTPKTDKSGGYTILQKNGEMYVLCKDGMFRRIVSEMYRSAKRLIVIDQSHSTFYNPVHLY